MTTMTIDYLPLPGTPLEELDTPALIVDLDKAEENIRTLQAFADANNVSVRPHVKTHKSPYWALKQIDAGAIGVCTAKVGEAEAMVDGGIGDILVANEVVGQRKITRLVALAKQASITVVVDDATTVDELSQAAEANATEIDVLIDVNIRINRCGVEPGQPVVDLAKRVDISPGLVFKGLMGYEGHIPPEADKDTPSEAIESMRKFLDAIESLEEAGLKVEVVSAGGTSTYAFTGLQPRITELQCGTYIFMDAAYRDESPEFKPALTVLSQVMSKPTFDRAILDIGLKSVSVDSGPPEILDLKGATLTKLSEEHGTLQLEGSAQQLKIGDKVSLLPAHGDTTINIHSHYFCVRNGVLEAVVPITARGKFT